MQLLTRTIWILSLVSLFTDMASEMLYPIMPVYLKSIGYSVVIIGLLEGLAEAIAGFSKGYFGKLSDQQGRRVPFVQWGYMLSAISKPLMGLFPNLGVIFSSRTIDRLGKGIRTGARDALLADESHSSTRGKIFGFHRSMDTIGAVLGPSLALIYLYYNPEAYAQLFIWAFIPGIIAVAISFLLKEKKTAVKENTPVNFFSFVSYWNQSTVGYRKLVGGLLVFAVINSSDVFLLLMMKEQGTPDTQLIGIYIFYNLVYAIAAFPLGIVADKIGLKKMLCFGLFVFAIVYGGMAIAHDKLIFLVLFALYGIYAAATEGISKALISNNCDKKDTATAIGTYTAFQSIATLLASSLAGWIWYQFGATYVFIYASLITACVVIWMIRKI